MLIFNNLSPSALTSNPMIPRVHVKDFWVPFFTSDPKIRTRAAWVGSVNVLSYALPPSRLFFLKMGHTRPLFLYFHIF